MPTPGPLAPPAPDPGAIAGRIRSKRRRGWVSEWNLTATHPPVQQGRTQAKTVPPRGGTMRIPKARPRSTALAALGLALAAGVAALGPGDAGASSHREAPLIAADPAVDNTDVYAFVSPNRPGTSITDPNLLFRQTYTLQASFNGGPFQTRVDNAPVAPSRVGPASMPDYA